MKYKSIVASGTHRGVEWQTHTAPRYGVNGYMRIPEGHPWYGLTHEEINRRVCTERFDGGAGELTYHADDGWIGFDTQHVWDSWPGMTYLSELANTLWTPELVAVNARRWCDLIVEAGDTPTPDASPLWRDSDRRGWMRDGAIHLELVDAPYITVVMSRGWSVLIDDADETVAVEPEHLPALIATLTEVQRRIEAGDEK